MRHILLIAVMPILLSSCGTKSQGSTDSQTEISETSDSPESAVVNKTPDITMSAAAIINATNKDENFGYERVGKRIEITNVKFGGKDILGKTEIHLWASDGEMPRWNNRYMSARFILKFEGQEVEVLDKLGDINRKYGTVIATLNECRENMVSYPMFGGQVPLKEYVFVNPVITLDPEAPAPIEQQTTQVEEEPIEDPNAMIVSSEKAYFHEQSYVNTKRDDYLIKGQKVVVNGSDGIFFKCTYTNEKGETTTGWILRADLQ